MTENQTVEGQRTDKRHNGDRNFNNGNAAYVNPYFTKAMHIDISPRMAIRIYKTWANAMLEIGNTNLNNPSLFSQSDSPLMQLVAELVIDAAIEASPELEDKINFNRATGFGVRTQDGELMGFRMTFVSNGLKDLELVMKLKRATYLTKRAAEEAAVRKAAKRQVSQAESPVHVPRKQKYHRPEQDGVSNGQTLNTADSFNGLSNAPKTGSLSVAAESVLLAAKENIMQQTSAPEQVLETQNQALVTVDTDPEYNPAV